MTSLSRFMFRSWSEKFAAAHILKKRQLAPGPVGHIMGPARATLAQIGGQNLLKNVVALKPLLAKIEIAFF